MSDISVGKLPNNKNSKRSSKRKEKYSHLKKEYKSFIKKSEKSDFINSPVFKQKEFEMLVKMKEAAEKEGFTEDVLFFETRIAEIAAPKVMELPSVYYPPISSVSVASNQHNSSEQADIKDESTKKLITNNSSEQAETENKEEEINSQKNNHDYSGIVSTFKQNGIKDYELSYLLEKLDGYDDSILPEVTKYIEVFANLGVNYNNAIQAIEDALYIDKTDVENPEEKLNTESCQRFADFKRLGLEDVQALKFTRFLNGEFKDKDLIKTHIINMLNSEISEDAIINILDSLSINDLDDKKTISPASVKSVINLKKTLKQTRDNEKKERENPINQLGVYHFEIDGKIVIMKDNEVTYISPAEGENVSNVSDLKKEYNKAVSEIEDNLLMQFASKHNDGTNQNCLRIIAALRRSGVTYDQLFKMTDFCIADGNIDSEKLNTICRLKKAGCLSGDIINLMDSFIKTQDGKYDEEDIKNACDLTSAVIGGKEVAALLPEVYGNDEVKQLLMFFSQLFDNKKDLEKLLPLIQNKYGAYDLNAISVLYDLAKNLYNEENSVNDNTFLINANNVINAAISNTENIVDYEGKRICSAMCQNGYTTGEIIQGLNICKDKTGHIDKGLSELLCRISLNKIEIDEVKELIDSTCIDKRYKMINHYTVQKVIQYLKEGLSISEIKELIKD